MMVFGRDKFPNFMKAQRERGPFYNGPPIPSSADRVPFAVWVLGAALLGIVIGLLVL